MDPYDALVEVQILSTYYVVVEVEADSDEAATEKIRWQAQGLSRQELDLLCDGKHHPSNSYAGGETTVVHVGQVGPVGWAPEDDEAKLEAEAFEPLAHQPERLDDGGPPLESPTSGR